MCVRTPEEFKVALLLWLCAQQRFSFVYCQTHTVISRQTFPKAFPFPSFESSKIALKMCNVKFVLV